MYRIYIIQNAKKLSFIRVGSDVEHIYVLLPIEFDLCKKDQILQIWFTQEGRSL